MAVGGEGLVEVRAVVGQRIGVDQRGGQPRDGV